MVVPAFICAVLAAPPSVAQIEDSVVSALAGEAADSLDRFSGALPVLAGYFRERAQWHSERFAAHPTETWRRGLYHDEVAGKVLEYARTVENWELAVMTGPSLFFYYATAHPSMRLSAGAKERIGSFVDRHQGQLEAPDHRWLREFSSANIREASRRHHDALFMAVNEVMEYFAMSADNMIALGYFNDSGLPDDVFRALTDWAAIGEAVDVLRRIDIRLGRQED